MRFGFHAEAEKEYAAAIQHYLTINLRLANDFISQIEHGICAIQNNPGTWRIVEGDVRRYLVHRFPYGLYYSFEPDFITIWAVLHLSRAPDTWRPRIGTQY